MITSQVAVHRVFGRDPGMGSLRIGGAETGSTAGWGRQDAGNR